MCASSALPALTPGEADSEPSAGAGTDLSPIMPVLAKVFDQALAGGAPRPVSPLAPVRAAGPSEGLREPPCTELAHRRRAPAPRPGA